MPIAYLVNFFVALPLSRNKDFANRSLGTGVYSSTGTVGLYLNDHLVTTSLETKTEIETKNKA
jgi:hypothetical protein